MLTTEGEQVWQKRLHKKKVLNLQFSPREPYIFVSASVDNVVKVFDVRNIRDSGSSLCDLAHDHPVNSAYFSRVDGARLLTTDQHSQLRVYK